LLAIGWGSDKPKAGGKQYVYKSVTEGGDQIEYEDEDRRFIEIMRRLWSKRARPAGWGEASLLYSLKEDWIAQRKIKIRGCL
jgi:hypothetical protein